MAQKPMGIGALGNANLILKRKFRWTFGVERLGKKSISPSFVKIASRPNLSIEETEINYLNAKTWIPGKASWETITVTYYDVATIENKPLFDWLASVYDFTDDIGLFQGSSRRDYAATGILTMYDGCGYELERWTLSDMWPQSINFGELDYSSSEEATIELTLRYSNVKYQSLCPAYIPEKSCGGCNATGGTLDGNQTGFQLSN